MPGCWQRARADRWSMVRWANSHAGSLRAWEPEPMSVLALLLARVWNAA